MSKCSICGKGLRLMEGYSGEVEIANRAREEGIEFAELF